MEALLKLSGVINDEDGDRADLLTLERRLADKSRSQSKPVSPSQSPSDTTRRASRPSSPQADKVPIPISSGTSPEPPKDKEEEVEQLSDLMCSLVTNNCGETRYIGISEAALRVYSLTWRRVILRLLHLLSQRHSMGQREDRRQLFPRDDLVGSGRRYKMDPLAAGDLQ